MAIAPIPLPHWLIWDARPLQACSGPVYRAISILAVAYWRAGCKDFPTDEVSLASLLRLPTPHIRPIKSAVLNGLAEITPDLDAEYQERMTARMNKIRTGYHMQAVRRANDAQRKSAQQTFAAPTRDADTPTPRPPIHHVVNGSQFDRDAAITPIAAMIHGRNGTAAASKAKPATFTD